MEKNRIFSSADHFRPSDGEPIRSVVAESGDAVVVAWHVKPGQIIPAHVHPHGQDVWTILAGSGDYRVDAAGASRPIRAGDVVIAHAGEVHGVTNTGDQPLLFVSVVSPPTAGFQLV